MKLCDLDLFQNQVAVKIIHPLKPESSIVILKKDGQYFGYENICPHFSVQLDYRDGEFLIYKNQVIMCAHHSALFEIETGLCIDGPCKGKSLHPIHIETRGGVVFLQI